MRVALDATPLTLSSGGLRRYTEQLSLALAQEFPENVYTLISDQEFALPVPALPNLRQGAAPVTRIECKWWLFGASLAMRRLHAQVFHGTNFEVPYLNLRPSVVTVHDLSPWKKALWQSGGGRVRARTPWLLRLGIATMVVTPSAAVRREVIESFGVAPERVIAVPLGPAILAEPGARPAGEAAYFLFVGTLEPRKNVEMLVEAWRILRRTHAIDLVLAGKRRDDGPDFADEAGLRVLGEVTDAELAGLYRDALAVVYPSHYEGFGLPVLEAMQSGAAVVISEDAALREVGGDAALSVNSARELLETMRALATKPELLGEHRTRSLRRASHFSWRQTARGTNAVYGEALARFG